MRGADGDEDAGLADFQAAEAMGDGDAVDGKFGVKFARDFAHFGDRHGLVSFVIKVQRATAVRLVADTAIEGDDCAVASGAHVLDKRWSIDRLTHEQDEIGTGGHWHRMRQPPLTGGRNATSSPE